MNQRILLLSSDLFNFNLLPKTNHIYNWALGNKIRTFKPPCSARENSIFPACNSIIFFQIDSPKPEP